MNRLKSHFQNEAVEDNLRKELLDQQKKHSELRATQEKQLYETTTENFQKIDLLQQKWEGEKKLALQKLKEELALKSERIKDLEKNEKKYMSDREKADSFSRQLKEIQEKMKSLTADRDLLNNEKMYLEEKIKKYDERILDLEYQIKAKK